MKKFFRENGALVLIAALLLSLLIGVGSRVLGADPLSNIVNTITIMCPPIIFANRRTQSAAGFVNIPNNSIIGMIGNGNFNHSGTSGQKISFQ